MKWFKSIFSSDYGMLGVLILLCGFLAGLHWRSKIQRVQAAFQLYENIQNEDKIGGVLIAGRKTKTGNQFVEQLKDLLKDDGWVVLDTVQGGPPELANALRELLLKIRNYSY